MSTADERGSALCPQCGTAAAGDYCGRCGTSLDRARQSVAAELRSAAITPVVTFLSFLKTTWLMLTSPTRFYRSYLTGVPPLGDLDFPLSRSWRRLRPGLQKAMPPFRCLASAIALIAIIGVARDGVWHVTGLAEHVFGGSASEVRERQWAELEGFYQQQHGRRLTRIDLARLTGVGLIDQPARQILDLLHYMYFPLVVALFVAGKAIKRHALMHFYVYAVAASLTLFVAFNLVGLALFAALAGMSLDAAMGLSGVPVILGYLAKTHFVVVLPIVVLPRLMPVTRRRLLVATLIAAMISAAGNVTMIRILFGLGVVLA